MKELFIIDKDQGIIEAKVSLDREQRKTYDIPVIATDSGGRSGFTIVRVKVGDENDNQPVFLFKEYKIVINANYSVNMPLIKVSFCGGGFFFCFFFRFLFFVSQTKGF